MNLHDAVFHIAAADGAIDALITADGVTRYGRNKAEQGWLNQLYAVRWLVGGDEVTATDGPIVREARLQNDYYGPTGSAADDLAEVFRTALTAYAGTIDGLQITQIFADGEPVDEFEVLANPRRFRVTQRFIVRYCL
jgi:hypothetical protein